MDPAIVYAQPGRVQTEVVEMINGDRVTGEVKGLNRGELQIRTNHAGTVGIDWDDINSLTTVRVFEVELADGRRPRGIITSPAQKTLRIDDPQGAETVAMSQVLALWPIGTGFFGSIDGSFDLGFSYTRGSGVGQTTTSFRMVNRRPAFATNVSFDGSVTSVPDEPTSSRYSFRYIYLRYRGEHWFVGGLADAQRNTDQGLSFRGSLGGGLGRFLLRTGRQEWALLGGVLADEEVPINEPSVESAYALITTAYSLFILSHPKTTIDASSDIRLGLTETGRVLFNLRASIKRELWRDFYISATMYDTFDNRPPEEGTLKNDIGTTLSIGWTF
jgi:hypothetical protein